MKSKKKKEVKDWKEVLVEMSNPTHKEMTVNGQEMMMTDRSIKVSSKVGLKITEPNGTEVVFNPEEHQKIKESNDQFLKNATPPENLFCSKKFTKKEDPTPKSPENM